MDIIEYFQVQQKNIHSALRESVRDLSVEEWHIVPGGTSSHIAFIMWHSVRTEDNILHLVLQQRKPLWTEERWFERLELSERLQGTGMSTLEAQSLRINDPALFMTYAEKVWKEFESYLAQIQDGGAELSSRIVTAKPLGTAPAIEILGQACIAHLLMHVGEVATLVGLQGKRGMPF